ncbi:hypothetical protein ABGV49_10160 [Chromobacterium vaccinii]|uniref:Uncharacterized protein n=1 Tax=Chromobacterium vaccinii TaxID=1108595 RepID=A0ABV0FBG4_9NEIS
MSLEGKIAELVTATNGLISTFNGKKNEIDQSVLKAVAAVPNLLKTWYVDQAKGDDKNNGSENSPFSSIEAALNATPFGGGAVVFLKSDYVADRRVAVNGKFLYIVGAGDRKKYTVKYCDATYNGEDVRILSGFLFDFGAAISIGNLDIKLPSIAGDNPERMNTGYVSMFSSVAWGGQPVMQVKLWNSTISAPDDFKGWLVNSGGAAVAFEVATVKFSENLKGKYINGVPGGTLPSTLKWVLTNIDSF